MYSLYSPRETTVGFGSSILGSARCCLPQAAAPCPQGEELSYLHINNQADTAIQLNKRDSETYLFFPLASVFVRCDLHRPPSDTDGVAKLPRGGGAWGQVRVFKGLKRGSNLCVCICVEGKGRVEAVEGRGGERRPRCASVCLGRGPGCQFAAGQQAKSFSDRVLCSAGPVVRLGFLKSLKCSRIIQAHAFGHSHQSVHLLKVRKNKHVDRYFLKDCDFSLYLVIAPRRRKKRPWLRLFCLLGGVYTRRFI